jgi:pimeloyl-ACP methyl ester carboxylesterase
VNGPPRFASVARLLGGAMSGLLGAKLAILWAAVGCSTTMLAFGLAFMLVAAGLLVRRLGRLGSAGAALLATVVAWRAARCPRPGVEVTVLPGGGSRIVNRLVEERDGTLPVGTLLRAMGSIPHDESRDFLPGLRRVYDRMDAEAGSVPSPAVATYLGMEHPSAFDVAIFRPPGPVRFAVVFLHGYAGNCAVYCWVVARAALPLGAMTVCPSVGPDGRWWLAGGPATVAATLEFVRRQGVSTVVLAGLSNGGLGASRLAPRFRDQLSGLMLISGCESDAPSAGLPTLVVHGRADSLIPVDYGRACAKRDNAAYAELDSGHFMLIDHDEEVTRVVRAWLTERFGAK